MVAGDETVAADVTVMVVEDEAAAVDTVYLSPNVLATKSLREVSALLVLMVSLILSCDASVAISPGTSSLYAPPHHQEDGLVVVPISRLNSAIVLPNFMQSQARGSF